MPDSTKNLISNITKWLLPIVLTISTALVGYQSLKIKTDVLDTISRSYISTQKFEGFEKDIAQVKYKIEMYQQFQAKMDANQARMEANLENLGRRMDEIRNELKELNATLLKR